MRSYVHALADPAHVNLGGTLNYYVRVFLVFVMVMVFVWGLESASWLQEIL